MADVIKKEECCPECKAYNGHWIQCSLISVEEKAAQAMHYYNAFRKKCEDQHDIVIKWQQWAVMWQGKHAILRHENNKLRRALYRQEKKAKTRKENQCSPSAGRSDPTSSMNAGQSPAG